MNTQHTLATTFVSAMLAFSANANIQDLPDVYCPGTVLCGLSDNGAYAISLTAGDDEVDNPHSAGGTYYELATKEKKEIKAPSGWAVVNDIADNGTVVGAEGGRPGYWTPDTEKWTTFSVPSQWGGGCFTAVTPDAKYAVGYYFHPSDEFQVSPMFYDLTTGSSIDVPNLPTKDLAGENKNQNLFYGISSDGRYLLGQMSQSYWLPVGIFSYVYDTKDNTWSPIGYDYDAATETYTSQIDFLHFIQSQYMSCDGKWVSGSAYCVWDGGESVGGTEGFFPYRYNIADKTLEIYSSSSDMNVSGEKIIGEGVLLASSPKGNPYPTAMVRYGNYFIPFDQIIEQVYGMAVEDLIHDSVTGSFQAISADGLTAVMITNDNSYVIRMKESFEQAASKVDLLAKYSVSIPEGSTMSRISEVTLTFDRQIECQNAPKTISLLDGEGNLVRNASGVTISPSNDNALVVSFRSTALNPGENYTVNIPSGMVWLKGDKSIMSKEINLHYVGRQVGPIQLLESAPKSGASIAQINAKPDFITLKFDTQISISKDAAFTLYNADNDAPIATVYAVADAQYAYLYTPANCLLFKGTDYKLVISAGSITDLSGEGGCEEIILDYKGAYVRQTTMGDKYLFKSDCDSYDNFMFWQGDFNVPASTPESWGFIAENPWLLVRENETSSDWALAAHSMFSPAGESDDWLITPQIYVPDASATLIFDAQRYLRIKEDILRVYVYASDVVLNYFDEEQAKAFRAQGNLVFGEVIPAGATDEGLSGEWGHYTVDLSEYAGKNIYIAFVNQNNDQSAVFIDNISVTRELPFLLTNQTPAAVVAADEVTISGILSPGSEESTLKGVKLTLIDANGDVVDEIDNPDVLVTTEEPYSFSFSKRLSLSIGQPKYYTISVSSGDNSSSYPYMIKDMAFETVKKVVLEEYTGSTCGNCPLGILAIENLKNLYPDNFIAVAMRTYMNDMYAGGITGYTNYLELNAAPSGRINRGPILSPMMQNGSAGYVFFGAGITTSDGSNAYLWADAVQDELSIPAEASISFTTEYDETTGELSVPCTVRFAMDQNGLNLGVFAVIIEDHLPTFQLNYFAQVDDPNLGEWGLGGIYGQTTVTDWEAEDVARFVVNGSAYSGTNLPYTDYKIGGDYTVTLNADIPTGRLNNAANCKMVVMLLDKTTGAVINAEIQPLTNSGIHDVTTDEETETIYYNLQGVKIDHPQHGQIYIRVNGGNASKVRF